MLKNCGTPAALPATVKGFDDGTVMVTAHAVAAVPTTEPAATTSVPTRRVTFRIDTPFGFGRGVPQRSLVVPASGKRRPEPRHWACSSHLVRPPFTSTTRVRNLGRRSDGATSASRRPTREHGRVVPTVR